MSCVMWAIKLLIFLAFLQCALSGIRINVDRIKTFRERVLNLQNDLDNQKLSTKASRIIENIPTSTRKGSSSLQFYACTACQAMIDEFMFIRRVELFNETEITEMAIDVCSLFEFDSEKICSGIINLYAPTVIYIIDNRPDLTADTVCKFLLNDGDCANPYNDDTLEFTVAINEKDNDETPEVPSNVDSKEELIIVHLTDIHVDLKYQEGSLAACNNFACCRGNVVKEENISLSRVAGYWGSYNHCDTPLSAIEDAFRQIIAQHPVSILLTRVTLFFMVN